MRHEVRVGSHIFPPMQVLVTAARMGPIPMILYDAALGACEALTVALVSYRKGIRSNIEVSVERVSQKKGPAFYRLDSS